MIAIIMKGSIMKLFKAELILSTSRYAALLEVTFKSCVSSSSPETSGRIENKQPVR